MALTADAQVNNHMQDIVETLCALAGVKFAGIYQGSEILSSNFPADQQSTMSKSNGVVAQIFFALESVQKSHNELYFGIDGGYLAAFRLYQGYTALLLTDRKINIPMLSMAIKSAAETIKHQQMLASTARQQAVPTTETEAPEEQLAEAVPVEASLLPVLEQYTQILTGFLGPAARVVMDDAIDHWKQTYVQTPNNLTYLLASLEEELETDKERKDFAAKVGGVTLPVM